MFKFYFILTAPLFLQVWLWELEGHLFACELFVHRTESVRLKDREKSGLLRISHRVRQEIWFSPGMSRPKIKFDSLTLPHLMLDVGLLVLV